MIPANVRAVQYVNLDYLFLVFVSCKMAAGWPVFWFDSTVRLKTRQRPAARWS